MRKITRMFFALLGLGLLAIAILPFSEEHAAATQPMPVSITNTPLPVQGTVSVGNSPSVNVANTPSVNVANTPNVNISNSSMAVSNSLDSGSNPIPLVVSVQGTPYTDSCSANSVSICYMNPLNTNARLVVQAVSFNSDSFQGAIEQAALSTVVNGVPTAAFLPLSNTATDSQGALYQAAHVSTLLYSDAGSTPHCSVLPTSQITFSFVCTVSGYLVPAP
jgi:hypothetical protein